MKKRGGGQARFLSVKGFTLAEVSITLGIIGIVAAMTLPALIQNHRKQIVESRLSKFYSIMNQAVLLSEVDNGPKKYWPAIGADIEENEDGTSNGVYQWFNKYLKPYMKVNRVVADKDLNYILIYFVDGSLATFSNNAIIFYPEAKDYSTILNEESGKYGIDYKGSGTKAFDFAFWPSREEPCSKHHNNKGVEPYKWCWNGTREMLINTPDIGCKKGVTHEPAYCAALIQMNGWKIPKDYPFKF